MEKLNQYFLIISLYASSILLGILLRFLAKRLQVANEKQSLLCALLLLIIFTILPFVIDDPNSLLLRQLSSSEHIRLSLLLNIQTLWWLSLAHFINQLIDFFVWKGMLTEHGISTVPKLLSGFVSVMIYAIAFTCLLEWVYDRSISTVLAASGVFFIMIGYAARDSLGNILSGLTISMERYLAVGDWISIGSTATGEILHLGWRSLTIKTYHGYVVIIPNNTLAKESIQNYTRPNKIYRVWLTVYVEDNVAPHWLNKTFLAAIQDTTEVLTEPAPQILASGYEANGAKYVLEYWILDSTHVVSTNSSILSSIWYRMNRAGIRVTAANHQVFLPPVPAYPAPLQHPLSEIKTRLQNVLLFKTLTNENVTYLAESVKPLYYGPPERIFSQGDEGSSLFILVEGKAAILIHQKDGSNLKVAELKPGYVFGEMALLTGEPRQATVQVLSESIVYEITKQTLEPILKASPHLVETIGRLLAEHEIENRKKSQDYDKTAQDKLEKLDSLAERLADRIKLFFGHA